MESRNSVTHTHFFDGGLAHFVSPPGREAIGTPHWLQGTRSARDGRRVCPFLTSPRTVRPLWDLWEEEGPLISDEPAGRTEDLEDLPRDKEEWGYVG